MRYFKTSLVILLTLLIATPSFAQSAGGAFQGIGNNDEPIQIEADKLEIIEMKTLRF